MQRLITLAFAATVALTAIPAQAALEDFSFSGYVQTQQGTGYAVNDAISGEFIYDTIAGKYTLFTIGSYVADASLTALNTVSLDLYSANYTDQISAVQSGGNLNTTFNLDLEGLNKWPSNNAAALLLNPSASFFNNIDLANSSFTFYSGDASGNNIHAINASLSTLTMVPEPGMLELSLLGLVLVGLSAKTKQNRG